MSGSAPAPATMARHDDTPAAALLRSRLRPRSVSVHNSVV